MKTSVIKVSGMVSALSSNSLEKHLGELHGVYSATVNYAAGNATVRYDDAKIKIADLHAVIHRCGYRCAPVADSVQAAVPKPARKRASTAHRKTPDADDSVAANTTLAATPAPKDARTDKAQPVSTPVPATPKIATSAPAPVPASEPAPAPIAPVTDVVSPPAPDPTPTPTPDPAPVLSTDAAKPAPAPAPAVIEQKGAAAPNVNAPPNEPAGAVKDNSQVGLSSAAARDLLNKFGQNSMPDTALHPLRRAISKLWAPVPWMLEAAVLLEIGLGKYIEAAIIASLLLFNAVLGFFQEGRAQATLAALKSRLALNAPVRRDGVWKVAPAAELVPGDIVKLSLGAVVAADVRLLGGEVLLDQSMLTGESVPIEAGAGAQTYAGALVRRGEAVAEVTATGVRTKFGRTAELVRTAHVVSSQQKAVLRVVRNVVLFNGVIVVVLMGYAYLRAMPPAELIPFVLTAVLASIPVALPATFTLAAALGARALAKLGVLPTRLSAVDEAASIDVLCADKTGTLTLNELKVTAVRPMDGFDEAHVLAMAALASSDGGQDPVDGAIRGAAARNALADLPKLIKFVPFDPATKMSEASVTDAGGTTLRVVKGAFAVVIGLTQTSPAAAAAAHELEAQGFRVLAVAVGPATAMRLAGVIALSDPPRADSIALITELRTLGVRTVMVTGDAAATAAIVAHEVGLEGAVAPPGPIPDGVRPEQFAVFAGVLPEVKYNLVKAFQNGGHMVGMCGDGVNDAPALRQAQMGIAVSTATDVAKSAAGIVLTELGLAGIVASVKEGRVIFQRIQTYTLNTIIKKLVTVLFLGFGLLMTGHAILTPMLMVILLVAGDFLTMALTTDNVQPSPQPNSWRVGKLTLASVFIAIAFLVFSIVVMAIGKYALGFNIGALRTLAFLILEFGSQTTLYAIRERQQLWRSRPSPWLLVSSVADLLIASLLATLGILMVPVSMRVVAGTFAAAVVFGLVMSVVKMPVFKRLQIS